jgi:hypothetical protein
MSTGRVRANLSSLIKRGADAPLLIKLRISYGKNFEFSACSNFSRYFVPSPAQ